jgi:hypothetical protein
VQPAILMWPSLTLSHSPEQIWPPPGDRDTAPLKGG